MLSMKISVNYYSEHAFSENFSKFTEISVIDRNRQLIIGGIQHTEQTTEEGGRSIQWRGRSSSCGREGAAAAAALDRARSRIAAGSCGLERGAAAWDLPKSRTGVGGRGGRQEEAADTSRATMRRRASAMEEPPVEVVAPEEQKPQVGGGAARLRAHGAHGQGRRRLAAGQRRRAGPYDSCRRWLGLVPAAGATGEGRKKQRE